MLCNYLSFYVQELLVRVITDHGCKYTSFLIILDFTDHMMSHGISFGCTEVASGYLGCEPPYIN
jgi:hypothetical protein